MQGVLLKKKSLCLAINDAQFLSWSLNSNRDSQFLFQSHGCPIVKFCISCLLKTNWIHSFLIPDKEDDAIVDKIVKKMEADVTKVKKTDALEWPELWADVNGKQIAIEARVKFTQVDRKLIETISGIRGGICTLCKVISITNVTL